MTLEEYLKQLGFNGAVARVAVAEALEAGQRKARQPDSDRRTLYEILSAAEAAVRESAKDDTPTVLANLPADVH